MHRTIDIRQESRGKVHLLGRIYRKILEPICYWVGKYARKSALQKIESHEKLCRIMQKQTFDQIKELKAQIVRIERLLIGTVAFVIISLLDKVL